MRLIDADALKERIRRFLSIKSLDDLLPEEKAIVQHIDRMPTVDAVPVVHGRWSGDFCSKCGISKYNFIRILHDDDGPFGTWNFCPHCGADMREDGDNGQI